MPILGVKAPGPSQPAHFSLESLIRPNILALTPYRCARDDYSAGVLLDANENAIGSALPALQWTKPKTNGTHSQANGNTNGHASSEKDPDAIAAQTLALLSEAEDASLNRYPSPTHDELKRAIAHFRGVPDENWVFLGVGSDEVIDMLYRVLCVPGKDRVMTAPPTYGMYKVTANVNDVGVLEVPLITEDGAFQLDEQAVRRRKQVPARSEADAKVDERGVRSEPGTEDALHLLAGEPDWHPHTHRRHPSRAGQCRIQRRRRR